MQVNFSLPADSYVLVALREIVNIEKSGLGSMWTKMKDTEREEKRRKVARENEERERKLKEERDREEAERLEMERQASRRGRRTRSPRGYQQRTRSRSIEERKPIERLDGGNRQIKTTKENFIEVRLANQKDNSRYKELPQRHINPVPAISPARPHGGGPRIVDGVPCYEFQTTVYSPDRGANNLMDDSWNNSTTSRPPQPFEQRRSVFEGRLEERRRSVTPPRRVISPTRQHFQESIRKFDREAQNWPQPDLRRNLDERNSPARDLYDPEREFENNKRRFGNPRELSPEFQLKLARLDQEILKLNQMDASPFDRLGPQRSFDSRDRFRDNDGWADSQNFHRDTDERRGSRENFDSPPRPNRNFDEPQRRGEFLDDFRRAPSPPRNTGPPFNQGQTAGGIRPFNPAEDEIDRRIQERLAQLEKTGQLGQLSGSGSLLGQRRPGLGPSPIPADLPAKSFSAGQLPGQNFPQQFHGGGGGWSAQGQGSGLGHNMPNMNLPQQQNLPQWPQQQFQNQTQNRFGVPHQQNQQMNFPNQGMGAPQMMGGGGPPRGFGNQQSSIGQPLVRPMMMGNFGGGMQQQQHGSMMNNNHNNNHNYGGGRF